MARYLDDVFRVVDEVLGQVSVAEIDAPLVVGFFTGDVIPPDLVEQ